MPCCDCICETCARSAGIPWRYFTAGELEDIDTVCYVCEDDCWEYDHAAGKRLRRRRECKNYIQAQKYTQLRKENNAKVAEIRRKKFTRLK